jgi:hypothetical protein
LAKIDKSQYSKEEWRIIREQRRIHKRKQKNLQKQQNTSTVISEPQTNIVNQNNNKIAFVLGNGTSRKSIDIPELQKIGTVYACNAVYRTHTPDYLIAVDVKMILEINKSGYQKNNKVWTNPNKAYDKIKNLNYFQPSKGWSSGPTALWLASQHRYEKIYILGFDFKGLDSGKKFNNLYADSINYKKSTDGATFFGNWLRQTKTVIREHSEINYFRIITPDNYQPPELNTCTNLQMLELEDFRKIYQLS